MRWKVVFFLLMFFIAPCLASAQTFIPLGPLSNFQCIVLPSGSLQVGEFNRNGYSVLHSTAVDNAEKTLNSDISYLTRTIANLKVYGREVDEGQAPGQKAQGLLGILTQEEKEENKNLKSRIQKAEQDFSNLLTVRKGELSNLKACVHQEKAKFLVVKNQVFPTVVMIPYTEFGTDYVQVTGVILQNEFKEPSGNPNAYYDFGDGSHWCLEIGGPGVSPSEAPPYEFEQILRSDPCQGQVYPFGAPTCKSITNGKIGLLIGGIDNDSPSSAANDAASLAIELSQNIYIIRPETTPCNQRIPKF